MRTHLSSFYSLLVAVLLVSSGFTAQGQSLADRAITYNDKVVNQQLIVVAKYDAFIKAINDASVKADVYKKSLEELTAQLNTSRNIVKGLEKFDGKTEFADACLKLFSVFEKVINTEFSQVIAIYDQAEYTTKDEKKVNKLFAASNSKVDSGLGAFVKFQKKFAAKYHFTIKD